ncbi:MAG: hypothetical protein AAFY72_07770 [Cyanobacteria bacterium J06649_4]
MTSVQVAVALNCLLAVLVVALAYGLWRWRCQLVQLADWLEQVEPRVGLSPKQVGYGLALKRVEIAQTRLEVAKLQKRSHQIHQLVRLLRLLRTLMLYRAGGPLLPMASKRRRLQSSHSQRKTD